MDLMLVEGGLWDAGLKAWEALASTHLISLSLAQEVLKGAGDCIATSTAVHRSGDSCRSFRPNAKVVFNSVRAALPYLSTNSPLGPD